MNKRNFVMLAGTLAVVTVLSLAASAQTSIDFALPTDTIVTSPNPPGDPGDVLVITGRPSGTTPAEGCVGTAGTYPIQSGVVVDPGGGGRATRFSSLIVISQTTALDPGTKLGNITGLGACTTGGIPYNKYRATTQ
jgi:hypothetical protein